jgi:outer membrane protein
LDAYSLALANSPEWAAQREQYAARLESVPLARSQLLPQIAADAQWSRIDYSGDTINFNLDGDRINFCTENLLAPQQLTLGNSLDSLECLFRAESQPFSTTSVGIRISQPIFRLDRWHQLKRSQSLVDRASAELESAKQDLILETATTYFNVLRAKESRQVVDNEQQALTRSLRLIQKRFERGLAKSAQVFETQAQHDLGIAGLITAENTETDALSLLALLTRTPGIDTTALPQDIPLTLPQPEAPAEWARAAQTSSPELNMLRMNAKMAQSDYHAKKAMRKPTVDFFLSVTQTDAGGETPVLDEGANTNTTLGLSFRVPIFTSGGISANINQAMHQRQAIRWQVSKLEHELAQQVESQYRRVRLAVSRGQAQALAVTSTKKAYQAIERGYKAGTLTLNQLLQAQRSVYLAQRDSANARYDYVLETLRLKRLVGILGESDLQTLNAWLPAIPANQRINLNRYPRQGATPERATVRESTWTAPAITGRTTGPAITTQTAPPTPTPPTPPSGVGQPTPENGKASKSFAEALRDWLGR